MNLRHGYDLELYLVKVVSKKGSGEELLRITERVRSMRVVTDTICILTIANSHMCTSFMLSKHHPPHSTYRGNSHLYFMAIRQPHGAKLMHTYSVVVSLNYATVASTF